MKYFSIILIFFIHTSLFSIANEGHNLHYSYLIEIDSMIDFTNYKDSSGFLDLSKIDLKIKDDKIDTFKTFDLSTKHTLYKPNIIDFYIGIGSVIGMRIGAGYTFKNNINIHGSYGIDLIFLGPQDKKMKYNLGFGSRYSESVLLGFDLVYTYRFNKNNDNNDNDKDIDILPFVAITTINTQKIYLLLKFAPSFSIYSTRKYRNFGLDGFCVDLNVGYRIPL